MDRPLWQRVLFATWVVASAVAHPGVAALADWSALRYGVTPEEIVLMSGLMTLSRLLMGSR